MFRKLWCLSRLQLAALYRGRSASASARRKCWHPRLEPLEERCTPSWTSIGVVGGELQAIGDNAGNTGTLNHSGSTTTFNGIAFADSSFNDIYILPGTGTNSIYINGTVKWTQLQGYGGHDVVNLGNATAGMQGIGALVQIGNYNPSTGNGITDVVAVDTPDPTTQTATLDTVGGGGSLHGLGMGTGGWADWDASLHSLALYGGGGNNTYNVNGTVAGSTTTINAGSGASTTMNVCPANQNLDNIKGALTLNATSVLGPTETFNIYDQNDCASDTYEMYQTSVSRNRSALISYYNHPHFVNIYGGHGNATYNIYSIVGSADYTSATTLDTGPGQDNVNVKGTSSAGGSQGTLAVNTTTSPGGGGNNVVTIGNNGSLAGITNPVTVYNVPSRDQLVIDGHADATDHPNVVIAATGITGLAPAALNFTSYSISTLTVKGSSGNNTYWVGGTPAYASMTLDTGGSTDPLKGVNNVNVGATSAPLAVTTTTGLGGGGRNVVNITNLAGTLAGIQAPVSVTNPVSYDTVNVFDGLDTTPHTATIDTVGSSGRLTLSGASAPAPITWAYSDTSAANIWTGSGTAAINVLGTGTTTNLFANAPATINIGSSGGPGSLAGIHGPVNLENEGGPNTVVINDQNDASAQTAVVRTVTRPDGPAMGQLHFQGTAVPADISWDYDDTATATINTGSGGINVTVQGTSAPTTTIINGNPAATNMLQGPNATTSWNVTGANQGNFSSDLASATFTGFQNLTGGNVWYNSFTFANGATLSGLLDGGQGIGTLSLAYSSDLTVNITGYDAGNVRTASGGGVVFAFSRIDSVATGSANNNRFVFSNSGRITAINGGTGTNNTLDASAVTSSQTVFIYGVNAGTVPGMVFEFANIQNVISGSGNNTFVFGDGARLDGSADGGSGGTNTLDATPYTTGRPFSITGASGGAVAGMVGTFGDFQNVIGAGSGGNTFAFSDGGSLAGRLDGGVGVNNLLDYSASWSGNVIVNLQTGQASGVAGRVSNIVNVTGASGAGGYNLLVGNGNNVLTGGNGRRNLLIAGGSGASTLIGGDDEDILIAGTTNYDTNAAALLDIMNVWTGGNPLYQSYADRVNRLTNDASYAWSLDAATVHSNNFLNTLTGKPGGATALDLYFASLADTTDATPSDTVIAIS
jgi:hypothetical protein